MTPSAALAVTTAPPANTTTGAANGSSSDTRNDFSKPLQQAHQQLAQQSPPPRASTAKQGASPSASGSQPQAQAKGKADHKDDSKSPADAPNAAAAMLALLGQSVPASAAASTVQADGDGNDGTDAVAGTAVAASAVATLPTPSANLSLLGAAQVTAQPAAGGANTFTKAMDGVHDKSLSMFAQGMGDGDDSADASGTADTVQGTKGDALTAAVQALSSSSKQDHGDDPLDALKNLTAAATAQQPALQTNATTTPAPHVLTLQSSVGSPSFGQELSQQVTWLGGQDVKEARIRLHPEDLGELDVKVSVKQDHVDVAFIAQHPQAVHAVQQTLGQLDSMLAHHGLSLGQAMVGQGNTGQGSGQAGSSGGASAGGESGLAEGVGELVSVVAPVVKVVGLVDMFA
jgi:flagellar hook-length control protein FliK